MEKIKNIFAREILDSRGNPTVECDVELFDGSLGRASVPSGASTGIHEALELRDGDKGRYHGKGVKKAIQNINTLVKNNVINREFEDYRSFDENLLALDATENKSNIGANATLAASLGFAKSLANHSSKNFFSYINETQDFLLPVPMMNIINGGSHADNDVDIQEFMIAPVGAPTFSEALRYGCEIFHSLKSILKSKDLNTNVGDEGGFAPNVSSSAEVIEIILSAVEKVGLKINNDILLSLDVASTEFYQNNRYELKGEGKSLSSDEMVDYLENLSNNYPIYSIEDGMSEDDWEGWIHLTKKIGSKIQLVGDDLFVTNIKRLKTVLETLPLEVSNILPENNTLHNNPPLYGFTLLNKNQIPKCYTNNNKEAEVIVVNEYRIEVRTNKFNGSKARINCISKNANNRLLWHGSLYWVNN